MESPDKPRLISFPRFNDPRGNLSFIQDIDHAPFKIKRVEWIYDLPTDTPLEQRGYRHKQQLIVPLAGAVDVKIDDTLFHLARPYQGLYIPAGITSAMTSAATNTVIVILSSTIDDPDSPDTL